MLFLHHPFAHHLIDRRFHKPGGDLFPVAVAFPVIGHEGLVALDVGVQLLDAFQEFLGALILESIKNRVRRCWICPAGLEKPSVIHRAPTPEPQTP